jgi:phage tail sheath protein FI
MPEYLTPGVYVEELDTGNKPIEGVSTSTVGFLGVAERGPAQATLITSFTDYVRAFGSYYASPAGQQYYLAYAVEGFFNNGGQRCFVQAVRPAGALPAAQAADKMNITAVSGGLWGDQIAVKVEQSGAGPNFRITVMYWKAIPPNAALKVNVDPTSRTAADLRNPDRREPQISEVYDDLNANPLSTSYYVNQINGVSALITVAPSAAGVPNPQALTLMSGGTPGGAPVLGDFEGTNPAPKPPGQKIGLDAFTEIDEISLLCCPDAYALANPDDVNGALIDQCEVLMSRFAIIASTANEPLPFGIAYNSKYAAFYYPWINVVNPTTGEVVLIPPSGHVAGIYARSDDARGVQKDPANEVIRGIDSLQFKLTDAQQALLNPVGINALRYFPGAGNLVWGGRTTSLDPSWRYINVRRLFIFVEQSILRATRWAVFEVNDEPLWATLRRAISDFLTRMWMDDMLQGATKDQAFFVRCDRTTMTQADIDNGRLICVIGIAPVKPAEFVIFRIGQWAGGGGVSE